MTKIFSHRRINPNKGRVVGADVPAPPQTSSEDSALLRRLRKEQEAASLERRASALPKSKASQSNEPNYEFFYMSYYAAAHLLELKPIADLDLKSRKRARQIARRKQHTCAVCGHAVAFADERQGPEIIVVAKPLDRGDYLGGPFAGSAHQKAERTRASSPRHVSALGS
jgi:hypothetical protein